MTDITRKVLVAAACLAVTLLSGPMPLVAEEPLGIALEGFPYPYPVHMFVISQGGFNEAVLRFLNEGDGPT
jgi:hypothetical protein